MELAARLTDVVFSHDGRRTALDGTTFAIPCARTTAVVGANGSGKSTALAIVAGVLEARTGTVTVWSERRAAFVVQHSDVDGRLPITVRDTVAMGRWGRMGWWRRRSAVDREVVERCLDDLGLLEIATERLGNLSGGQRQRAMVAQGLAQQSDLLLLDEPTTGLDLYARQRIADGVAAARGGGCAVVIATHDVSLARTCDHAVLLGRGRTLDQGDPADVLTDARLGAAI